MRALVILAVAAAAATFDVIDTKASNLRRTLKHERGTKWSARG
jgi:hypothetical protein